METLGQIRRGMPLLESQPFVKHELFAQIHLHLLHALVADRSQHFADNLRCFMEDLGYRVCHRVLYPRRIQWCLFKVYTSGDLATAKSMTSCTNR